ncbi:MAG: EAL domain-containing protein [Gammaproteobacteria bacterium]
MSRAADSTFYLNLLRAYLDSANDAIFVLCDEMKFLLCNRLTTQWLGAGESTLTAHNQRIPITEFFGDSDTGALFSAEFGRALAGSARRFECFLRPDGERSRWVEIGLTRVDVEAGLMVMAVARDITEQRAQRAVLEHQLAHDRLTDLPNREELRRTLATMTKPDRDAPFALCVLDIDHFKDINDSLGYGAGDVLLRDVAERLRSDLPLVHRTARLSGNAFAVVLPDIGATEAPAAVARITDTLQCPFWLDSPAKAEPETGGLVLHLEASVGYAVYPQDGRDPESLLRRAELAMYVAKEHHGSVRGYEPAMELGSVDQLTLLSDLHAGIDRDELILHYQPQVWLDSGRVRGVEALVRWQHPRAGLLHPGRFIPLAERSGLIDRITFSVLRQGLRQLQRWLDGGLDLTLSVNLSARNLGLADLAERVGALLDEYPDARNRLVLEITESAMMADALRAARQVEALRALGLQVSIDDFGVGYTSLGALKDLPVNEIKIDRSFVMGMDRSNSDAMIVSTTVDLARNFGFAVVAEGVENAHTLQLLRSLGCRLAQGYYICRPAPAADLEPWLQAQSATA